MATYICSTKESTTDPMKGSKIKKCSICNIDIMVAPSTIELLNKDKEGQLVCEQCFMTSSKNNFNFRYEDIQREELLKDGLTEEQIEWALREARRIYKDRFHSR